MTECDTPEEAAEREGVSLNQFISVTLAGRVTRPPTAEAKSSSIVDRTRSAKTVRAAVR